MGPGLTFEWPPQNWKKLSGDQRLMAHEFAAIFIKKSSGKVFPEESRKLLLDKYKFMSLEGEGKPQEEEGASDKTEANIRLYNFTYLKGIVKGGIEESRIAWGTVKSIEQADRWTDTDKITDLLDKHGLKIWM